MITGNDLIQMGFERGKWFGIAIEHINTNDLSGDAMMSYIDTVKPPPPLPVISLHAEPVKYFLNITAETELEKENVKKVCESMDILMRTPVVVGGCVMPDACPTGVGHIPVGGIAIVKNAVVPNFHSADICCSLMLTNIGKVDPKLVLDTAMKFAHFGAGGRPRETQFRLPQEILTEIELNPFLNSEHSISIARSHLGTSGDGNHFIFCGVSKKTGDTIIVSHYGSRGFGAALYKTGMKVAENFRKKLSPETPSMNAWIPFDTTEGENYWNALQTVRKWTKQNHICIHNKIAEGLNTEIKDRFWNEHNFVFKDGDLFYHAKGATPMNSKFMPDITGPRIIPLNMSQPILIVEGGNNEHGLGFAPHGAGRNLSRTQHKKEKGDKSIQDIFTEETQGIDARFFSGKIDISELPSAYKNAEEVKKQIIEFDLATIIDEITPVGCIMAGHIENNWRKKKK